MKTDRNGLPLGFELTGGEASDSKQFTDLMETGPEIKHRAIVADKGYDSNALRRKIEAMGAAPNIPPKINRIWKPCFSQVLYRDRNAIERMFGRIKDFRRIATRYDKLAQNFLAAVYLIATICYWL